MSLVPTAASKVCKADVSQAVSVLELEWVQALELESLIYQEQAHFLNDPITVLNSWYQALCFCCFDWPFCYANARHFAPSLHQGYAAQSFTLPCLKAPSMPVLHVFNHA